MTEHNDGRSVETRIDVLADAIALLAVSGSSVFGTTDAKAAIRLALSAKTQKEGSDDKR